MLFGLIVLILRSISECNLSVVFSLKLLRLSLVLSLKSSF